MVLRTDDDDFPRGIAGKRIYGDVPKWLKGPHSKCGRRLKSARGFKSLHLRHAGASVISLAPAFFKSQSALTALLLSKSNPLRRTERRRKVNGRTALYRFSISDRKNASPNPAAQQTAESAISPKPE